MTIKQNELYDKINEEVKTGRSMNPDSISDDELLELFNEKFEEVAYANQIGDYESSCVRTVGSNSVKIEVTVFGMAGSPTMDEFKNGLDGAKEISVSRYDKGDMTFKFTGEAISLNATDYIVIYEA